ncbi:MAG: CoA transferase [Chloroflexi bacterium]|nr:CoA transferase [Chloroflexota bacterium]
MTTKPRRGPLAGLRVLDIAAFLAAPFSASILADFGADVIKVELPGMGDGLRKFPPFKNSTSLHFNVMARNKRSLTLDLRDPVGKELFLRLVEKADLVTENFLPGTLEKWGLGYDVMKARNPRIVVIRVSGYGQTGPNSKLYGFGTSSQAFSGLTYLSGYPDRPPVTSPISLADYIAGLFAVIGALTAVYERDVAKSDLGQEVDVSLYEGLFRLMDFHPAEYQQLGIVRERTPVPRSSAPLGMFAAKDGHWLVLSVSSDSVFDRLAEALGRAELAKDPRFYTNQVRVENREAIEAIVVEWFGQRTRDEILEELNRAGVPVSPVYNIADIMEDEHYQARENVVVVEDPVLGPVAMPNAVPRLSRTPGEVRTTAPLLGQHSAEVLSEWLGLSQAQIDEIQAILGGKRSE